MVILFLGFKTDLNFLKKMIEINKSRIFFNSTICSFSYFSLFGYPVAITLAGTAIIVGFIGYLADLFL